MPEDKNNPELGLPEFSRLLFNDLFSRYSKSDEWINDFPELGYDPEEWDELIERGIYDSSGRLNKKGDDEDEDDDEDWPLRKSENDIQFSVKGILCQDYNAKGDKKFLILEDANSDWWDLPGGHLEDGESSDEALVREIYEETGLECDGHEEIFTRWLKLGDEEKAVMFFFSKPSGDVELSDEHTDYKWITQDEMDDYNLGVFADIIDEAFDSNNK